MCVPACVKERESGGRVGKEEEGREGGDKPAARH